MKIVIISAPQDIPKKYAFFYSDILNNVGNQFCWPLIGQNKLYWFGMAQNFHFWVNYPLVQGLMSCLIFSTWLIFLIRFLESAEKQYV